ncbi:MAG: putative bifunctional diguanylate cyclase/phosphodiesterase [Ilumatobacteraceae bacterium]
MAADVVGLVPARDAAPSIGPPIAGDAAQAPRAGRESGRATWIALAAFGGLIAAHAAGVLGSLTYSAVTLGGVGCAVVGIRRHQVGLRWPWWLLMVTGVLWTFASLASEATRSTGDLTDQRSLLPDALAIPGYVLFGIALCGVLRARRVGREHGALLDGVMLAAGAALIVNEVLIIPTLGIEDTWVMARLAVSLYPALSMCLLMIAGRLAFGSGRRSIAFSLLLLGTMSLFFGDVVFAFGEIGTLVVPQTLLEVPYLLVPACIGSALLHPSIRLVDQPSRDPVRELGPARLASVSAALLAPIVLIALDASAGRTVTVALCALLASTAVMRIGGAMRSQAESEAQLYHRATHDELTGLASRSLVVERTEQLLAAADGRPVALMFLDLDQFKFVNDSMGHAVGDRLLVLVADRLLASVRSNDLVGRISGDEFIIVSAGLGTDGAHALADRVRGALRDPFLLDEGEVFVSVSIGVSISDATRPRHAATLIQEADTAMYRSKDAGRDTVTVFDSSMRERVARRLELERLLRRALDERQISIWYQPIVTLPGGHAHGLEALARWEVDGRMISPAEFIPVAEESGLIVPLGCHVLDETCRQLAWWRRTMPDASDLYVSVNLSARQVWSSDIVDTVADTLRRHGLPGEALWLEITESVMMEDSVTKTGVLTSLRHLGERLAVDDFGTGYSSLSYLKRFPVSRVKIDRSFVSGLGLHESDSSLVAAIIAMASALELEPVAEGVETTEQARLLVELGCTQVQGFLYGSAVTADEVPELLRSLTPADARRAMRYRRCIAPRRQ